MIRTLVVDDSSFMRTALSKMLDQASGITVVDTATDGEEGVEKACELTPDVVTMDVEMPKMDGITAVRHIMDRAPCPILMISSKTEDGAETTIEAMQAGAADFLPKGHASSTLQIREVEDELVEKVRALSQSRSRLFDGELRSEAATNSADSSQSQSTSSAASAESSTDEQIRVDPSLKLIVIGVSTGGPLALQHVLPELPAGLPVPVAVTQHMPPQFTNSLADRLDTQSAIDVREATDGMVVEAGQAIVAAGGHHLTFDRRGDRLVVHTPTHPEDSSHRPSVDVMFRSACDVFGGDVLALMMTGMGKDGLRGTRCIKNAGGTVLAQNEASCVVYGMPRVVAEAGLADATLPLKQLSGAMGKVVGAPALS
ncbi:MAG: chemotaxis response regulator protein-glutamate methylesterase [Salinibacter sp.]